MIHSLVGEVREAAADPHAPPTRWPARRTSIVVLTEAGLALARRLRAAWGGEFRILGPSCVVGSCVATGDGARIFPAAEEGVFGWRGPLRAVFPTIWNESDGIVGIMALGIVVRLTGPLATDKRRDPAVVVVDDAGRFAISVLGGHGAAANEMAKAVAATVGAMPVITTASDSWMYPAPDVIGRELGWKIERTENLTRVAAAIVRGEKVAVYQDAGSPAWWLPFGPLPDHVVRINAWEDVKALDPKALLVISDRLETDDPLPEHTVVYRPPTLVAGIGCKRGTTADAIDRFVAKVFARRGLSAASLAAVATVTLKADEPGLIAFARARELPLVAFAPEELADQPGVESPSERVRSKIGIAAVAEPSALRAAGANHLLVPKQIGPGVTVAVARIPHEAAQ